MDDKQTPMEAEVQELPPRREPCCPGDSYGTAARPQPRRDLTWVWATLGLTVIAICTFSVVATMLHVRVETGEDGWRLALREAEETRAPEDPIRDLEVSAQESYAPAAQTGHGTVGLRVAPEEGETLSAADVYARVTPSVVCVEVGTYYGGFASYTGVVISPDGYILTATDGLTNAASVTVCLSDGSSCSAARVGEERVSGLCLLKVEAEGLAAVSFAEGGAPAVGQGVYCICNPYGSSLPNVFSQGMLSASWQVTVGELSCTVLQSTAQQDAGPGCPLLDAQGRLVGLTTCIGKRLVSGEDPCFALSAADLVAVIGSFDGADAASGCWLGLEVEDIPEDYLYFFGYPGTVWIAAVGEGTPAEGVLNQYDVITAVDGETFADAAAFNALIAAHAPGDRVWLTIYRSGKWYRIRVPVLSK